VRNTFNRNLRVLPWAMALLLGAVATGCGGGGDASVSTAAGAGTGVAGLGRGPAPVDLLSISTNNFVALSATGITNTGSHLTTITGNIGASPITSASMDTVFCSEMTGLIYGVDAANVGSGSQTCFVPGTTGGIPNANKTLVDQAVLDMGTAYADANARAPDYTELGAGNIGGMTLGPATYKWGTSVLIPTNVTLNGGPNDVWIFQIAQGLTVSSGVQIILAGGALPQNIYWATFAAADVGTTAKLKGVVLSQTSIAMKTGATINGRLLAGTAVTLDETVVTP
jgi:hypothetical protein